MNLLSWCSIAAGAALVHHMDTLECLTPIRSSWCLNAALASYSPTFELLARAAFIQLFSSTVAHSPCRTCVDFRNSLVEEEVKTIPVLCFPNTQPNTSVIFDIRFLQILLNIWIDRHLKKYPFQKHRVDKFSGWSPHNDRDKVVSIEMNEKICWENKLWP